jgi:hypothetical protein
MASIFGQAYGGAAVTPNDSTDLTRLARGLFVTGAGNIKVTMASGDVLTFSSGASQYHPIEVKRVWSTTTTATGIIALFYD